MTKLISAAAMLAIAASANAATLYSTGFESPTFVTGALAPSTAANAGQDTWTVTSTLFAIGNTAGFARTGTQYATVNTASYSSNTTHWGWHDNAAFPPVGGGIVSASVYVAVLQNSGATRITRAGLDLYNASGTSRIGMLRIGNDGSIIVNNELGSGIAFGAGSVTPNAYNKIEVIANFNTATVSFLVNGTSLDSAIDTASPGFRAFASTDFGDADLVASRAAAASGTSSGGATVLWDDLSITQVPAPASLALMGMGLIAGGRRRR